jgi:guanosine-3',5'-bis(diphosphate) 3'-pyrophosphohydrolase
MQEREQYLELGKSILQRTFSESGNAMTDKGLSGVLKNFSQPTVQDLYAQVGAGHITGRAVLEAVYPGIKTAENQSEKVVQLTKPKPNAERGGGVPIKGLIPGMAMHFAGCCHPLPGDRIVGIVTTGKGVTIHTIDCEQLASFHDEPERWIDVSWDAGGTGGAHVGRVNVTVANSPGALGDLSMVIARNGGNISNLKITSRQTDFFDMLIDIEVRDVKHLTDVIAALRASSAVNTINRARG